MDTLDLIRAVAVLGPVVALVVLGFAITMGSGVACLDSGQSRRRVVGNLSQTLLLLGACALALTLLQQLVGFPAGFARLGL